jgi:hypothetical protein
MSDHSEDCYEKLADLVDVLEDVTDWEHDRILEWAEYEARGRRFSEAQALKVEEMWEQYCS